MELERRLKKVARYHLALFILPLLSLLYYGWWKAPELDQRPDNPLKAAPMSRRGSILDRHRKPLAHSRGDRRVYPLKAQAGSLIGYHLRGRNQSGLEAHLQTILSPPPPPKSLWGALERDRSASQEAPLLQGPSVLLTLDSELQSELFELFATRSGALLVAQSNGEILAAVSCPSFDPNRIGESWNELRGDPRSPLIERVASGLYPVQGPSGETLLATQSLTQHPWFSDQPFPHYPGASSALTVDDRQLLSPLMLLQLAAGRNTGFEPRLLHDSSQGEKNPPTTSPFLPELPVGQEHLGFMLVALQGPAFRESPPFDAVLGRSRPAGGGLVFALVVEDAASEGLEMAQQTVAILRRWSATRLGPAL